MTQGPTIRVSGLRELQRALRKATLGSSASKMLGKANAEWSDKYIVPTMQRNAPNRTGRLARSVRASKAAGAVRIMVGSEVRVPYAGPINFGWGARNIEAQEFIYKSIAQVGDDEMSDSYFEHLDTYLSDAFPEGRL